MEEDKRLMVCDFCRKHVPLSDIKYVLKGLDSRTALCTACRTKRTAAKGAAKKSKGASEKKDYFCARCRFRFKFGFDGITNLRCPYCGKEDKITEVRQEPAEELIKASAENPFRRG